MSRWFIVVVVVLLYFFWFARRDIRPPFVERDSLTVVLPVQLETLRNNIAPLLIPAPVLHEIAVVCPRARVADTRHILRSVLSNATHGHPKVSLYSSSSTLDVVARLKTQWILLLDEHGLDNVSECDKAYLLHPRAFHLPVGPRGFVGLNPITPSHRAQPATFLVPPFVAPAPLLTGAPSSAWPALGHYIAKSTHGSYGGIVIGTDILDNGTCTTDSISQSGFLVLVFPRKEDLANFVPAIRKLLHQGYSVLAYLYDDETDSGILNEINCTVPYFVRSKETPSLSAWLDSLASVPDIIIGLDYQDLVSASFSLIIEQPPFLNTTLIRLPRHELPYTEWIGSLSLHQLRYWNVPEITLSIITNNRPLSLRRLLKSIQRTLFYGDKVNIRINMDQTSDPETMHIVHNFEWPHGDVFLHHRVIHGGLLPAVVESWYPHGNDSYGLLLEDDIELSPLSYAWIKMTLLRYKYADLDPTSSKLFGISLYQQKIIELRPTGRQPFDARAVFRSASLADPSTPYLSQIPCSWGALYFPNPWREFHDYLVLRLSQSALPIGATIVPGVRSNQWTKSWKKYFIELVYLRGYVMLYPNYDDFISLSTNHLEVGSHVKDEPGDVYEKKKRLFSLPLMQLSGALARDGVRRLGLLDLPGGALPAWDQLPVLDHVGELSSMVAIQRRGDDRRAELGACHLDAASLPSSVRDLLCHVSL